MLLDTTSSAYYFQQDDFDPAELVMNNQQQQDLLHFFQQQQQQQQDQDSNRGVTNFGCTANDFKMSNRQFPTNSASNGSASNNFLEPTPISHFGINVVDQLPLANSALNVVSGQQQQELTDWIQVLRNNGLAVPSQNSAAAIGSMPSMRSMQQQQAPSASFAFASQQHSGLNPSFASPYEQHQSIDLQHCPREDTLDYRRAESARLMQQSNNSTSSQQELQIRPHQNEKWQERYLELCNFHKRFGHSVVPYHYKESSALAWWVKR